MANLQTCSRCKSTIDISYFGLNRKKQPYKTCVSCRRAANSNSITCVNTDTVPSRPGASNDPIPKIVRTALEDIELMINIIRKAYEEESEMNN